MSLTENNSLKAKIEQTRAAREAFLRGTTVTSISNSSIGSNNTSPSNPPLPSKTYPINSSNREIISDKANVAASLNTNGSHYYQNIQQLNKPGVLSQNSSVVNTKPAPAASTESNETKPVNVLLNATPTTAKTPPTSTNTTSKQRKLDGYVGFANLPNQVYRKSVKKGFEFNLMVIGESGLGKSTFINSLFLTELYNPDEFPGTFERSKKTACVDSTSVLLNEKGVNLKLTIVDTPGFGEAIDNSNCWQPITEYIDSKYEDYLSSESKVNRKLPMNDQRIHCCLFFISAGHTLKQLDIEVMKKLHDRVNLIPVIAKADTMTSDEIKQFKKVVLDVIAANKIQIYEFPDIDDDDVENNHTNSVLKSKLPFAVVGSNKLLSGPDGKTFRGRQYPWGVVNVDELAHCDFMALRTMLIRTHMHDLKDVTNNVHYENYRFKKLAYVGGDKTKPTNKNPFQQLEEEKKEAESRLEKMKNEMEGVFDQKVKEKISRLKESELNLEKQQEAMRQSLEKEEKELEEKRLIFLREKQQWEDQNREEEERLKHSLDKEADKKKKKMF